MYTIVMFWAMLMASGCGAGGVLNSAVDGTDQIDQLSADGATPPDMVDRRLDALPVTHEDLIQHVMEDMATDMAKVTVPTVDLLETVADMMKGGFGDLTSTPDLTSSPDLTPNPDLLVASHPDLMTSPDLTPVAPCAMGKLAAGAQVWGRSDIVYCEAGLYLPMFADAPAFCGAGWHECSIQEFASRNATLNASLDFTAVISTYDCCATNQNGSGSTNAVAIFMGGWGGCAGYPQYGGIGNPYNLAACATHYGNAGWSTASTGVLCCQ